MEPSHNDELSGVTTAVVHATVMIVDEDAWYARVLHAYLELRGWAPVVCSAREAMRDMRELRPRAVVLDFDAPGIDAFELLHAMSSELAQTQVLVCSRFPEPLDPERSSLRELGVTRWLRRPCSMEDIARALDHDPSPSAAASSDQAAQTQLEA